MNPGQHEVFFSVTPPNAVVDNAAYTCNVIDTAGYDKCDIYFYLGPTDIAMATLKVQESDVKSNTTALTGGADVTGLIFGTSNTIDGVASALPASTADNTCVKCEIDLKGRKRYLLPVATAGDGTTGTYLACFALLRRAEVSKDSMSDRGFGQILRV